MAAGASSQAQLHRSIVHGLYRVAGRAYNAVACLASLSMEYLLSLGRSQSFSHVTMGMRSEVVCQVWCTSPFCRSASGFPSNLTHPFTHPNTGASRVEQTVVKLVQRFKNRRTSS